MRFVREGLTACGLALLLLLPACSTALLLSTTTSNEHDSGVVEVEAAVTSFACKCQRACAKLQAESKGASCYGDCGEAPESCSRFFDCILDPSSCSGMSIPPLCATPGCNCGAWYHGGGACVQDWYPPPTGDCPDRCDPNGPTCRPGTVLAEGRCQVRDGG